MKKITSFEPNYNIQSPLQQRWSTRHMTPTIKRTPWGDHTKGPTINLPSYVDDILWLMAYITQVNLFTDDDTILCKDFPSSLKGLALMWWR